MQRHKPRVTLSACITNDAGMVSQGSGGPSARERARKRERGAEGDGEDADRDDADRLARLLYCLRLQRSAAATAAPRLHGHMKSQCAQCPLKVICRYGTGGK